MAHDAVRDLQHPGDLGQRLRLRVEGEQVVNALGLVVDLVGEASAAPDVMSAPTPARALDALAHARDDLLLPVLRQLRVEHEQNLVADHHRPESLLPTV